MKHIQSWDDLRQFGIHTLTGEACAVGLRILCDLTPDGVRVIREVFGLPDHDFQMAAQTRTLDQVHLTELLGDAPQRIRERVRQFDRPMSGGEGVASIMLPRSLFTDLAVMACLLNNCEVAVLCEDGSIYGVEPNDVQTHKLNYVFDKAKGENVETDDPLARLKQYYGLKRVYGKLKGQPAIGINSVGAIMGNCAGHN